MDNEKRIKEIELRMREISSIPMLKSDSSIKQIVDAVNKITQSIKQIRRM